MTPGDTARILAKAAAFDSRTVGESDVMAWHEVLGHLDVADCLGAITEHYRESTDRAMPAGIRRLAISIRDARKARDRQAEARAAIEAGPTVRDRSADVAALVRSVAASLPQPDAHTRAVTRARSERGRPATPLPRHPKTAGKPSDYPAPTTDDVAALATRYLIDGYPPDDVATRLAVSRTWCRKTARRMNPTPEGDQS